MEDITDADYMHTRRVCKGFKTKKTYLNTMVCILMTGLKKIKEKLDLLTGIDMLLMAEKGSRKEICHTTHGYAIANNIYKKNMIKIGNCQQIVRELLENCQLEQICMIKRNI